MLEFIDLSFTQKERQKFVHSSENGQVHFVFAKKNCKNRIALIFQNVCIATHIENGLYLTKFKSKCYKWACLWSHALCGSATVMSSTIKNLCTSIVKNKIQNIGRMLVIHFSHFLFAISISWLVGFFAASRKIIYNFLQLHLKEHNRGHLTCTSREKWIWP